MPLNMDASILGAERVLGYTFNDRNRLWEALQAPGSGVWMVGNRHLYEGNKRLALKGDAALKNVIITDWYSTDGSRASADRLLQSQVSNGNLHRLCIVSRLDRFINLNKSSGGVVSPRTMADTMEAILGAVVEDGGEDALRAVMRRLGFVWL